MQNISKLFENNREWVADMIGAHPDFFERLMKQQDPEFLWIGCADSRVPANEIVGLLPGELFVHRNVANVVVHTDLNCLSVIQYAVDVLKVKHIIVCGHYGCGGVQAALDDAKLGLIDNWLRHVQDVVKKHKAEFDTIENSNDRYNRVCELNVIEQAMNVCDTTVVQDAWNRGQELSVHGWVYSLQDGIIRNLHFTTSSNQDRQRSYQDALKRPVE
jgi:carbonic anhydrase